MIIKNKLTKYLSIISLTFSLLLCSFGNLSVTDEFSTKLEMEMGYSLAKSVKYDLYDAFGSNRYALYVYPNNSYLIFDNFNNSIVERSPVDNSNPYSDVMTKKKYYVGLASYLYEEEQKLFDIEGNQINLSEQVKKKTNQKQNLLVTTSNESYVDYEVPYANYFKLLDGSNNDFARNDSGDCGYVASAILLGYLATFYNSDILCSHYLTKETIVEDYLTWPSVGTANSFFKNEVLKLNSNDTASISTNIYNCVNKYFSTIGINDYRHVSLLIPSNFAIADLISRNIPIVLFSDFTYSTGGTTGSHAVLAYGTTDLGEFEIHLGKFGASSIFVTNTYLFDWLQFSGSAYYIDPFSLPHVHGRNLKINDSYYCMKENLIVDYADNNEYRYLNSEYHNKICDTCGHVTNDGHLFTSAFNGRRCIYCNFYEKYSGNPGEIIHPAPPLNGGD